jgi:HlyD family secretion protein
MGMMESQKRKSLRGIIWAVLAGLALGLGGYAWLNPLNLGADESAPGRVVTAFRGDLTTVVSARGQVRPQEQANLTLGAPGRVAQIFVAVGDEVQGGDSLIRLETAALERAVRLSEQDLAIVEARLSELLKGASPEEVAIARAALASAQAQLDRLRAGPRPEEIAVAEDNLKAAQSALWAAAEQRDLVLAGPSDTEIAAAQAQVAEALAKQKAALDVHDWTMKCETVVDSETGEEREDCPHLGTHEENARFQLHAAEQELAAAQTYLNLLLAGPGEEETNIANANVGAFVADRDAVQHRLDLLEAGSNVYDIAVAEAGVAQAQAALDALLTGASAEQLAVAEAQVEQARIALAEAQENLVDATLFAPFDGVVTAVYVTVGEMASGPVAELVNPDSLELVLDVDEVDIGAIAVGQQGTVTLEAWPNVELQGEVVSISPQPNPGEVISFAVHLSLDAVKTGDPAIRSGMSAVAHLVTSRREGALLVPNETIIADREASRFYVNLLEGETVALQEVHIGLRDSAYTEILNGLEDGAELLIEEESARDLLDFSQGPPREIRELRQ